MENDEYPNAPVPKTDQETLEELAEHILFVEDVAVIAANRAKALEFFIGNLLAHLARNGTLDSRRYLDKTEQSLGRIESLADRSAAESMLSGLRSFLPEAPPVPPESPGSATTH